jgi:hypothetical protein
MNKGDLARVEDDVVPMFHDCSLSDYTLAEGGEFVVVINPDPLPAPVHWGMFVKVLHPRLGFCYIRKQRLEVLGETTAGLAGPVDRAHATRRRAYYNCP